MELQDVSPGQEAQSELDAARAKAAQRVVVADGEPDPLRRTVTVRNPLVPQPEPDANPLIPLINRPSRSRSAENTLHPHPVEETLDGAPVVAGAEDVSERMTRAELDAAAREAGVENPEDLSNKGEVIAAIEKAK